MSAVSPGVSKPRQRRLDRLDRQEQLQRIGRQLKKTKLFIVALDILILRIHKQTNPTRRVENVEELTHCCHQEDSPNALVLVRQ